MQDTANPLKKDGHVADYAIVWKNPSSMKKGSCKIFTYGRGKEIAVAAFYILFPGCTIDEIVKL